MHYKMQHEETMREVIGEVGKGTTLNSCEVRVKESSTANFICDAICSVFGAEICFVNGGFVRGKKIHTEGQKITTGDIFKEVPFQKNCLLIELLGKDVMTTLEEGVMIDEPTGCFMHVSKGLSFEYSCGNPPGSRVVSAVLNGEPIDCERRYLVVTTTYLYGGGDGYSALKNGTLVPSPHSSKTVCEVVVEYVRDNPIIQASVEGRCVCVG